MAATPINILINGESIVKYFDQVSIKFVEGMFCNSIDLSVKTMDLWTKFDPILNFGDLVLEVPIGSKTYKFLVEERNATVGLPGVAFSVWGRSAQALLDRPYSKTVTDTEDTKYPWQTRDCTATQIINYIQNLCCPYTVIVNWNVENFIVYKDSFSASNTSPIDVISQLAGIIGAEFIANPDGSLTVQEYSVSEGIAVQEYNDLDHIVSLSEDLVYPIGFNSVIVNGFSPTDSSAGSSSLTAELQEDDLKGWEYNKRRKVRCYYYHPKNLRVISSCFRGTSSPLSAGTETFTEWIVLVWGEGNTSHPNTKGVTEVLGSKTIPLAIKKVSYQCKYQDFAVASQVTKIMEPPYGVVAFYFTDHTNTTTMTLDYYEPETEPGTEPGTEVTVNEIDGYDDPTTEETGTLVEGTGEIGTIATIDIGDGTEEDTEDTLVTGTVVDSETGTTDADVGEIQLELDEELEDEQTASLLLRSTGSGEVGHNGILLDNKVVPGYFLYFIVWGDWYPVTKRIFDSVYVDHTIPNFQGEYAQTKEFTEEVMFTRGQGNISKPYYDGGTYKLSIPGIGKDISFYKNKTSVTLNDYNPEFPIANVTLTYLSRYSKGQAAIPSSYVGSGDVEGKPFYVYLEKYGSVDSAGVIQSNGELLSVSKTVTLDETMNVGSTANVVVIVKDFATEVIIPGASVYVDGSFKGYTNEDGEITLYGISVGDHAIKLLATGYLDSDEDALANDTFTVSAPTDLSDVGGGGQLIM